MNSQKNIPYIKQYEGKELKNPITKENPYISGISNKKRKFRKSNNRKGTGIVISKIGVLSFVKYHIIKYFNNNELFVHSVLK